MQLVVPLLVFSVGLSVGVAPGGAAPGFVAPDDAVVDAAVRGPPAPLPERLRAVTERFVGAPYSLSPLGEGPGAFPDADPLLRFDAFDCTTFVETAMALALAKDLDEGKRLLNVLRYREAKVDYLARRHFPEAEWIPELQALGFLEDITRAVGGSAVVIETKRLDLQVWKRTKHQGVPTLPDERIPAGTFSLPVWPFDDALRDHSKIPPGTLLHLVRVDYKNVPVRVTHQGLVIEKDGVLYLRHAADRMHHSVVDERLDRFFLRMSKYKRWPIAGVHLTAVREPPQWRQLLPQPQNEATLTTPSTPTPPATTPKKPTTP